MGHFSKYLPRGSIRVDITNTVIEEKVLTAEDVKNSQPLVFMPCDGSELQSWTLDQTGSIFVEKTQYECIDVSNYGAGPRLDTYSCAHSPNQMWERRISPTCTDEQVAAAGVACSQLVNTPTGKCLTKVTVSGAAIGLDAGTKYTVGQALPCKEIGDPSQVRACVALACLHAFSDPFPSLSITQTFDVVRGDMGGFPDSFPIKSPPVYNDGDKSNDRELCLQPYVRVEPTFDATAFITPKGSVSIVAMNTGEESLEFTLYDHGSGLGSEKVTVPPHSIQTFELPPSKENPYPKAAAMLASTTPTATTTSFAAMEPAAGAASPVPGGASHQPSGHGGFMVSFIGGTSVLGLVGFMLARRHRSAAKGSEMQHVPAAEEDEDVGYSEFSEVE